MLVYLIGPSGAGKSTIAAIAVRGRPDTKYVDLDGVIRAGDPDLFCHDGSRWNEFWSFAVSCLKKLDLEFEGTNIIDCGAGCLQTDSALSFFQSVNSVIAFIGLPQVLFERAKRSKRYWANRTLEEYQLSEFSSYRECSYDTARFKLYVSSQSAEATASQLLSMIEEIRRTQGGKFNTG